MPNSLLDFVMSLVRDPDAAAHYAADPAGAIADANLTDVTTADVNHLIPVVAESFPSASPSSALPSIGAESFGGDVANNVWASGAATAAFDAFDDHLPQQVVDDPGGVLTDLVGPADGAVIDTGLADVDVPAVAGADDPGLQVDSFVIDDLPVFDTVVEPEWASHLVDDHQAVIDDAGVDDLI